LKLNIISPLTYKLIDFDDFVNLYLIFHKGNYSDQWKLEFWQSFIDPLGRQIVSLSDFLNQTCKLLSEQHKTSDQFIREKTFGYLSD